MNMITGGLSAPTSSALGIAAATAAPAVQYQIGQIFKDNQAKNELDKLITGTAGTRPEEGSALHILAHTILAASVAAAGGNDALTAGLSAGGAEALAPVVSNWLYGKDTKELTADEKATVSNIVSLGAAGLTAGAGGTGADVVSSSQLASSAVEDNRMLHQTEYDKAKQLSKNKVTLEALSKLEGRTITEQELEGRILAEMMKNSDRLIACEYSTHDYHLRQLVGCNILNCSGLKGQVDGY